MPSMPKTPQPLQSPPTPVRPGLRKSERVAVAGLAAIALAYAVIAAIGSISQLLQALTSTGMHITLDADSPVPVDAAGSGTATILSGSFASADLIVTGASSTARALLGTGILVTGIMHVTLAVAFALLCLSLVRGRPFTRSMTWLLTAASAILILGGVLGQGFIAFAQFMVAAELTGDSLDGAFPIAADLNFLPILVGIGLGAVASAFEIGQRMQRDTDGLV